MEHPCTYCKQTDSKYCYPTEDTFGDSYDIHQCNQCEAFFLTPLPTDQQLARAYDDSYYGEGEEKFEGLIEKILDYFRKKRAAMIAKFLEGKGRVLDIGCGNGRFLSFMKKYGNFELNGIEMEGGSAERARRIEGLKLNIGTLERGDYEAGSIDAISLFHVFEHLTEPVYTLEVIHEILRKDGILVMSFPNIDSRQSKWFKGKWLHLDPPRHIFFIAPKPFKALMKAQGYELIHERHFSMEYNPFGFQQSLLNRVCKKREVLYEHLKGNKSYVAPYSKFNLVMQELFFKLSYPLFIIFDAFAALMKKGGTVEFVFRKVR